MHTSGRIYTDLYCRAIKPGQVGERYGQVHGHYIGRIHGALMAATGRVLRRAEDIDYHHGKVFYAARCPDPKCEMISEFEILAPAEGQEIGPPVDPRALPPARPLSTSGRRRRVIARPGS